MNELIGFIVLSGPLFLIVIFAVVAIVIILVLRKKVTGTKKRLLGGLSIFGIVFFLLFGDEIVGKMYLEYLCESKSGVKIYKIVYLPSKYWSKSGEPKFQVYDSPGSDVALFIMDSKKWQDKRFNYTRFVEHYNNYFNIEKKGIRLSENLTGKILGEFIYFRYWGGWFRKNLSLHNTADTCDIKNIDNWKFNIFKPVK